MSCATHHLLCSTSYKLRYSPFTHHIAGGDRLICLLHRLALAFAAGCFKAQKYSHDEMNYLFPKLMSTKSVTTALSQWLQALGVSSNNATYQFVRIETLPNGVCAASIRVGSTNEMALATVVPEFMIYISGHEMDRCPPACPLLCTTLHNLLCYPPHGLRCSPFALAPTTWAAPLTPS